MQLKAYKYEGIPSNWEGGIEYLQGGRIQYLQEAVRKNKKIRRSEKTISRRKREEGKTIIN